MRFLLNFFDFFYERVIFSLQNPRSKFHVAVASCCGDMLKFSANTTISFLGAFLSDFFNFQVVL